MAWYDYLPVVGSLDRLGQGDVKGAIYGEFDPLNIGGELKEGIIDPINNAYDQQEIGYHEAQNRLRDYQQQNKAFQMEGLDKAEGYYGDAKKRLTALYGEPGSFRK